MLELGEVKSGGGPDDSNQQWLYDGELLVHVRTGYVLDTEVMRQDVGHSRFQKVQPWELSGTMLQIAPQDGSARQRWEIQKPYADACVMFRHTADGRALDVNFGRPAVGQGVNVNLPSGAGGNNLWHVSELTGDDAIVAVQNMMQRSVASIVDQPDIGGPPFTICFASPTGKGFCLAAHPKGGAGERCRTCHAYGLPGPRCHCVYLSNIAPIESDAKTQSMQQWRWVGNRIQNVGSGEFLHADSMHVCVSAFTKFWEGTISVVETRAGDEVHSSEQIWTRETGYGSYGNVLWHQSDGRLFVVDWHTFKDGQGMLVMVGSSIVHPTAALVLQPAQGELTDRLTS
eukprot:SAG31_NODE_11293_length_1045_cov_1.058140_1_plen_343_part_10